MRVCGKFYTDRGRTIRSVSDKSRWFSLWSVTFRIRVGQVYWDVLTSGWFVLVNDLFTTSQPHYTTHKVQISFMLEPESSMTMILCREEWRRDTDTLSLVVVLFKMYINNFE